MAHFIVQSDKGQIMHDFSFHLIEAIKYDTWFHGRETHTYVLMDKFPAVVPTNSIPVGSISFVQSFYEGFHNIPDIKPIHIPEELCLGDILCRRIYKPDEISSLNPKDYVFIKDVSKFKGLTSIVQVKDIPVLEKPFLSEFVPILSEWRGFVLNGILLDTRCYSGDFEITPDFHKMREMIKLYHSAPGAYTLDVAVLNNEKKDTALIEIHHFFSCGLYGFQDYSKLIKMYSITHREILKLK